MSEIFGILADVRTARVLSALTGLLVLLPVAACGLVDTGPSAKDAATAYLDAFARGQSAAAARHTDSPKAARELLAGTWKKLSPKSVRTDIRKVADGEGDAPTTVRYSVTWDFGKGRVWRYDAGMELRQVSEGWKVHWAPSVIHPKLGAQQTLDFEVSQARPAPILGRTGVPLMKPQELVRVILVPKAAGNVASVAGSLASGLSRVAPTITQKSIMDGVAATPPGQAYTVVTLRRADYEAVKSSIYKLPGVRFPTEIDLVTTKPDYAAQVLPSVAEQLRDRLDGRPGWRVLTRNAAGVEVATLHSVEPQPAGSVRTTLSDRVQSAAEKAVDPLPKAAMIVAMKPSNGDILAVAQNAAADKKGSLALMGQYPPGSTFKIVTALAALETGKVNINTPVQCPAKTTINGKVLPNSHNFDLGTVPLRTAFAKSCNTTFARLALELPPGALTRAAKQLGLGADFVVPGVTTLTGDVPKAQDKVQRAVNGIGQGTVLATPFGMALASASVAKGGMPTPTLVEGSKTSTKADPPPPPKPALDQLRTMMSEVVTSGTATELQGLGPIAGKTGTAQFGDGTRSHGWFVGYRGDLAFAVLMTDAGTSERAVAVARSFLTNTQ